MKFFDIDQNTPEWYRARAGIPTASAFNRILTKTGKISTQAKKYAYQCVAEIYMQRPYEQNFSSEAMEWGNHYETEAINCYEMITGNTVKKGGFFTDDNIKYGCSPDARIYDGQNLVGTAEIKCLSDWGDHIGYVLLEETHDTYIQQIQGQMLVTGCEWVDWFSYHPDMPYAKVRFHRDEKYIENLHNALIEFDGLVQHGIATLKQRGFDIEKPIKTMDFLTKPHTMDLETSAHIQSPVQGR